MDSETGSVSPGGSLEGLEICRAKEQILKATQDQPLTREGIRDAVEAKTTITVKALSQLKEEGVFTVRGTGKRGDPFLYQVSENFAPKITDPLVEDEFKSSKKPVPSMLKNRKNHKNTGVWHLWTPRRWPTLRWNYESR
jgi:hypothetical protein